MDQHLVSDSIVQMYLYSNILFTISYVFITYIVILSKRVEGLKRDIIGMLEHNFKVFTYDSALQSCSLYSKKFTPHRLLQYKI